MNLILIHENTDSDSTAYLVNYDLLPENVQTSVDDAWQQIGETLEIDIYKYGVQSIENNPALTEFNWLIKTAADFISKVSSYREVHFYHSII